MESGFLDLFVCSETVRIGFTMVSLEWAIAQGIFLAIGVFQLVVLLWELRIEIAETRTITPRGLCLRLTCATTAVFVINYLDPRAVFFYPNLLGHFIDYFVTISIMQCASAALYMYLLIVFQQTLTHVPKRMKNIWFGINVISYVLEVLFLVIGTAANDIFWLGIDDLIMFPIHSALLFIVWNANLAKVSSALRESQKLFHTPTWNVQGAVRKVYFLRFASFIIWPVQLLYTVGVFSSGSDRLSRWGTPIEYYENQKVGADVFSPIAKIFLFFVLLYALRRPRKKRTPSQAHLRTSSKSSFRASAISTPTVTSVSSPSPTFSPHGAKRDPLEPFELDVVAKSAGEKQQKKAHNEYTKLQDPTGTDVVLAIAPRESSPQLTTKRLSQGSSSGDSSVDSPQQHVKRLESRPSRGSASSTPRESPQQQTKRLEPDPAGEVRQESPRESPTAKRPPRHSQVAPDLPEQQGGVILAAARESPQLATKRLDEQQMPAGVVAELLPHPTSVDNDDRQASEPAEPTLADV